MTITGSTTLTGIFGYPVSHSLSPAMHNAAFAALGLDFAYVPFEVRPQDLGRAVKALTALNVRGVNVTIPHKESVVRFLDSVDPLAKRIGSVNTVVNDNGRLRGYNTDGRGFLKDISSRGVDPKGATALILGAGGGARAVAATLAWAGAKKILITSIEEPRAKKLALGTDRAEYVPSKLWKTRLDETDILINTTPLGMHAGDPPPVLARELRKDIFVYDIVYNRRTELSGEARKARAGFADGLGMLLWQGVLAFELWTGRKAPVDVMRKALVKALKNR